MTRKIAWAAFGYVIVTFVLGFTWHLILFKDVYHSFGIYTREKPIIPLGLLSMIIQGPILASLYARYQGDGSRLVSAIKFCFLMGSFFASGTVIALAAKSNIAHLPRWFEFNFAFHFIQFGLVALIFAYVFKEKGSHP